MDQVDGHGVKPTMDPNPMVANVMANPSLLNGPVSNPYLLNPVSVYGAIISEMPLAKDTRRPSRALSTEQLEQGINATAEQGSNGTAAQGSNATAEEGRPRGFPLPAQPL